MPQLLRLLANVYFSITQFPAIFETTTDNISVCLSDLIMEKNADFLRKFSYSEMSTPPKTNKSSRKIGIALMSLSFFAGAYGLHGLGWTGGLIETLQVILNDPKGKFPGTEVLLIRKYTGVAAIDGLLRNLVPFFWSVVEMSYSPLTLFSFFMFGQYGVAWALFVMESLRNGNKKKVVS
jgi:hypothetical protein